MTSEVRRRRPAARSPGRAPGPDSARRTPPEPTPTFRVTNPRPEAKPPAQDRGTARTGRSRPSRSGFRSPSRSRAATPRASHLPSPTWERQPAEDLPAALDAAVCDRDARRVRYLARLFSAYIWDKLAESATE